jgi:hypothetical protein
MDRTEVSRWIEAYERAWRSPGTEQLAMVFAPEVTYRTSPWAEPVKGLDDLAVFWEHDRHRPGLGRLRRSVSRPLA